MVPYYWKVNIEPVLILSVSVVCRCHSGSPSTDEVLPPEVETRKTNCHHKEHVVSFKSHITVQGSGLDWHNWSEFFSIFCFLIFMHVKFYVIA